MRAYFNGQPIDNYMSSDVIDGVDGGGVTGGYTTKKDATLLAADWTDNTQTVKVNGVLSDETKQLIQPIPVVGDSQTEYYNSGIICIAQGNDYLTFKALRTPAQDIDLIVSISRFVSDTPEPASGAIYGAEWDGSSSQILTRTDDAEHFDNPDPYVNDGNHPGYSPFDDISPWKDMTIEEHPDCGKVVKIPKFYYNLTQIGTGGIKVQISMTKHDGFMTSPAHVDRGDGNGERDVIYVGRYHSSNSYKSVSGATPITNISTATALSNFQKLGKSIWNYDFSTWFTVMLLYLVEFANWDSQELIGYGGGNGSSIALTGGTDKMPYHTGTMRTTRAEYSADIQYRYIENLWSNVTTWLSGLRSIYNNSVNVIFNPSQFTSANPTEEYLLSNLPISSPHTGPKGLTVISVRDIKLFAPTATGNTNFSEYTCDMWAGSYMYSRYSVGCGYSDKGKQFGISSIWFGASSEAYASMGCRLIKLE